MPKARTLALLAALGAQTAVAQVNQPTAQEKAAGWHLLNDSEAMKYWSRKYAAGWAPTA